MKEIFLTSVDQVSIGTCIKIPDEIEGLPDGRIFRLEKRTKENFLWSKWMPKQKRFTKTFLPLSWFIGSGVKIINDPSKSL